MKKLITLLFLFANFIVKSQTIISSGYGRLYVKTTISDTVKCYFLRLDQYQNEAQSFVVGYDTPEVMSEIVPPKWFTGYVIINRNNFYSDLKSKVIFLYSDKKTKVKETVIDYYVR